MQWQMLQYYINNRFKRGNKMKLFDNHSHLNDEKFDSDREKIIKEIIVRIIRKEK